MDLFDVYTNKRIIAGNFPDEMLYPAEINDNMTDDVEQLAAEGLSVIKEYPELFSSLFMSMRNRCREMNLSGHQDLYIDEVNVLINTHLRPDLISPVSKSYMKAVNLLPVVTEVDKILWTGVDIFYTSRKFDADNFSEQNNTMFYALLYILLHIEKKEYESGKTVNVDNFIKTGASADILLSWDNARKGLFVPMTAGEKTAFEELNHSRDIILNELRAEIADAKNIAHETESEWRLFIEILNNLAQEERNAINAILQPTSAKEKIASVYQFKSHLYEIEKGKYRLNDEEYQLIPVLDAVNNRFQKAHCFSLVYTDCEQPFLLFPTAMNLVIAPATYNYLLILFHLFRMKQDKETAKEFTALALRSIKNNLGISDKSNWVSLNDIIEDFYSTVISFYKKNEAAIKRLSFKKMQSNLSTVDASLAGFDSPSLYMENLYDRMHEFENSEEYDRKLEEIFSHREKELSPDQILKYFADEEKIQELKEQEEQAAQLIKSLNIIYMFCEALRMILGNKRMSVKLKDAEKVARYRKELLLLDDKLVHKVYEDLDPQEIGMLEYREKYGITAGVLFEQETQEENFRNKTFSDILKNIINELTSKIEKQDTDELIEIKKCVREEILRFPECDEKEQYAEWIDAVSDRISNALVSNCKAQDDYVRIKESIAKELGQNFVILPDTTLDSLTTAEMLYSRYASSNFEDKGFDFSCISALYYQAFEEAYNKLIWKKYSDFLNSLIIDGQAFTDILERSRGISIKHSNAVGYLDNDAKQRDYYVEYKSKWKQRPKTSVSSRCMYTSFSILLGKISVNSELDKFCEFFATLAGFTDKTEMFNDARFMSVCQEFSQKVSASSGNRNNASHGGTFISLEQCSLDKKTVLYELKDIRDESLGLIQLLLSIVKLA